MYVRKEASKQILSYTIFFVVGVICADSNEAPIHGDDNGIEYKIVCPHNGAMTGINYRSTMTVDQIEFICTSSLGIATLGPYGGGDGKIGSAHCPANHYISSFYGSNTTTLNHLGIRCRHQNDMYSEGNLGGDFGEENGTHFDELSLSIGARPVSLTVYAKNNEKLNAIQVTYSNVSSKQYWDYYKNDWAEILGNSIEGDDVHEVTCPKDGAIIAINFSSFYNQVFQLTFKCASSLGYENKGPFGSGPEIHTEDQSKLIKSHEIICNNKKHIGYLSVTDDSRVNSLSGMCVPSGQATVYRPVEIKIWSKAYVNAIQAKYENTPLAIKCEETEIQLMDDIQPELNGYEVLGIVSGSTCSALDQQLCLTVLDNVDNSKTDSSSHTDTKGKTIGGHTILQGGFWAPISNGGGEIDGNIGLLKEDKTGSVAFNSNVSSSQRENSAKTTISYQGPGAAILVGYRAKYKIEKSNVTVNYHYTCEVGSMPSRSAKIPLNFKQFENVYFQDYQFPFKSKDECTSVVRDCISNIKIDKAVYHPQLLDTRLKTEFNSCLTRKKGSFTSS